MPRLKPSGVLTNRDDRRQGSVTQPYHVHQHLSSPGSAVKTPVPSSSSPILGLGNRPDLTVIVNKPKITSPAPTHVYGKPTISSPQITPTRTSGANTSVGQNYSTGFFTPKRDANVPASSYREPPPAHSVASKTSYPVSVITKAPQHSDPDRTSTHEKTPCPSKPVSITVKASDLSRSGDIDGVLNLDIKTTSSSPVSSCSISVTDVKPKPPTVSRDIPSTSFHTAGDRNTSLYNSQKVVKIEKRVNYDVCVNKPSSNTDSTSKYQQNAVWKEQPVVKTEAQQKSTGAIDEQKQKLCRFICIFWDDESKSYRSFRIFSVELLHNANFQQLYSQAHKAHANDAKTGGTENVVVSSLTKHMNHINRISKSFVTMS